MGGRRIRSVFVSPVVAAAFVLSACGGGSGDPTATSSGPAAGVTLGAATESAQEPTAEPEENLGPHPLPALTGATLTDNEDGAVAYVEYFMALMDYASTTGDLELWNQYSHENCQFCSDTASSIQGVFDAGYSHYSDATQIDVISVSELTSDGVYEVVCDVSFGRSYDRGPSGEVVNELDAAVVRSTFLVERLDAGSWITYEAGASFS